MSRSPLDPGSSTPQLTAAQQADLDRRREETPAPYKRFSALHVGDRDAYAMRKLFRPPAPRVVLGPVVEEDPWRA